MPIEVEWRNREASPRFFCDHCGEGIGDASQGIALWEEHDATQIGRRALFVAHRACRGDFERYRLSCTAGTWTVQDLGWFIGRLAGSAGLAVGAAALYREGAADGAGGAGTADGEAAGGAASATSRPA